ncbi:MAG TPA: protein kinase [Ktedonobacterales bacterium]|nr:protein kinase [Ktedonobacterales bacterium]
MEQEYIGRYRIIGRLGKGGMGTVVRALDEVRQREVAIKLPLDADPEVIRRLQRECDVLGQLQHHHIVQIYGSGNDPTVPFYIVMEYVEGTTVEDLLKQQGGPLEPRRALKIGLAVAEALAHAHRPPLRIVHRDIKPANVMIRRSDDTVKVTDFGIASVLSERTGGKTAIGTLAYMAPEQAGGRGVDERTDLYSLGVLLYEMLTGHRPPQLAVSPARPPSAELASILPPEMCRRIDRLVMGLLRAEPNHRLPQRAEEVVEELRALIENRPSRLPSGAAPVYGPPSMSSVPSGGSAYGRPPSVPVSAPVMSSASYPPASYSPPVMIAPQPVYQVVQVVQPPARPFAHMAGFALSLGILALFFSLCPILAIIVNLSTTTTRGAIDATVFWVFAGLNIPALLAILLGHFAQMRIHASSGRLTGLGSAITGLCFGYFCIIVTVIAYLVHRP